ncbi:hypothetical protein [Pontibacillus salipaludis]|uniref:Uncharacterized protein n=1 Tax=Pontibacillus salipaludis TaxID=1697394 RepID=A0ABQ1Q609_9BACI|nr:hypothetical protein [Pontibacillus salipaludis]GGD13279.1 hypothetical protein GCM10011389_21120 [Pontibacillus salipaludis]
MTKVENGRQEKLTVLSVFAGGMAGFVVNVGLSLMADSSMTEYYGISILLGVIVGLLWDITDKLNSK